MPSVPSHTARQFSNSVRPPSTTLAQRARHLAAHARTASPRTWLLALLALAAAYALGLAALTLLARITLRFEPLRESYLGLVVALPSIAFALLIAWAIAAHVGYLPRARPNPRWYLAALLLVAALWALRLQQTYSAAGLFSGLGLDFGLYYAQARLLLEKPGELYSLDALGSAIEVLRPASRSEAGGLVPSPVPYPPIFAWLVSWFARTDPTTGLIWWTAANSVAALYLAWRVATLFHGLSRLIAGLTALLSVPVMMALQAGQPMVLLAVAFGEFTLSLAARRNLLAGLWLSIMVLKPQYGLFVGPFLLWKRQWQAAVGAAIGIAALLVGSLLAAGPAALLAYPDAVRGVSSFYGEALAYPSMMPNWRALIVTTLDFLPELAGTALTFALAVVTVIAVGLTLRTQLFEPTADFPAKLTAVALTTQLANYHNNVHGAAILAIPFALLLTRGRPSTLTRALLLATVWLPYATLSDVVLRDLLKPGSWPPLHWAPVAPLVMACLLASILRDLWPPRTTAPA